MMDLRDFTLAISQIAEEKGIPVERVMETIEQALAAAYKKDYGKKGQIIKAKLDPQSGDVKFWQVKLVVDQSMIYSEEELKELKERSGSDEKQKQEEEREEKKVHFNPERHIMAEEAKKINPAIRAGEDLEIKLEAQENYGRIAAQTAKQVILQRIKEVERETILKDFKSKENEIVSGIVQRVEGRNVFLDIGKAVGIMPKEEQVNGEFYRPGQRLKVYVANVEESPKGPTIFLSRAYPKIISKLFELEVPEISQGTVSIRSIAREAGSRSKIAVASTVEGVDPIGSCVGQKGTRVSAVISELGGEKIDIVEYSDDPEKFIANSLSPAKVVEVKIMPKNKALAIVPEDQLSLAIGKDGQNVRLAAKLTGWKIDVRPPGEEGEEEYEDGKGEDEGGGEKEGQGEEIQKEAAEEKKKIKKQKKSE